MTQPKQTKRRFSPEFKLEAIEQVVKYQRSTIEVARALELDPSQLRKWIRQYKEEVSGVTPDNPVLTPEQREIQSLRAQIKRLEMEKEILKQAAVDSICQRNTLFNDLFWCFGVLNFNVFLGRSLSCSALKKGLTHSAVGFVRWLNKEDTGVLWWPSQPKMQGCAGHHCIMVMISGCTQSAKVRNRITI